MTDSLPPALQPYADLYGSGLAHHPEHGPCFICEGRYLVEEALKAGRSGTLRVLSVLAVAGRGEVWAPLLPPDTELLERTKGEIEALAGFAFHRGVLACVAVPPPPSLEALAQARTLLVLPRLDNVDNLGQLLRTASALGIGAVVAGRGPHPFARRTVRVSMGTAWRLPVLPCEDPWPVVAAWRAAGPGREVVGAALSDRAILDQDWQPARETALVLGPEDCGLDAAALAQCDRVVMIPMARAVDSLNVAAAGAILMARLR